MNCDEAFDFLTDPARRECDALRLHLESCPRCRQMQDVLAPAIDLLAPPADSAGFGALSRSVDESGLDLEQSSRPWTHPEGTRPRRTHPRSRPATLPAESILLAERTAADLARRWRDPRQLRRRLGTVVRFAAVFLLGVAITLSATTWSNRPSQDRTAASGVPSRDECLWAHRDKDVKKSPSRTSRQVVLSCVECHLGRSFE